MALFVMIFPVQGIFSMCLNLSSFYFCRGYFQHIVDNQYTQSFLDSRGSGQENA